MSQNDSELHKLEKEIQHGRPEYSAQLRIYDIFIPTLGGLIIVINLIIVFSSGLILRKRQQPRSTYIFLGSIALADMMTGVSTIFGQYFPRANRTEIVCCFQIGMIVSATLASIYCIALIAVDRYLYILYGLQYQRYLSSKRARCMVLATWILGCFVGFLPAMGVRNSTDNGRFCWLIILEPTPLILATVLTGFIPLILIITLYSIILKQALGKISEMRYSETTVPGTLRYFRGGRKSNMKNVNNFAIASDDAPVSYIQTADVVNEPVTTSRRSIFNCCRKTSTLRISSVYSPSRWKAIKIVLYTTGCFFCTWFPYFIACALYAICNKETTPRYCNNLRIAIASPLAVLGLANSLLNPLIYAWWHNGFRESTKKIYIDIWRRRICRIDEISDTRRQANRPADEDLSRTTTVTQLSKSAASDFEENQMTELKVVKYDNDKL